MDPLKQQLASLDDVDEALRPYYREEKDAEGNAVYFLNAEEPIALKRALKRQQEDNKALKTRLEEFEENEISLEAVEALKQELEEARTKTQTPEEIEERINSVKEQMRTHAAKDREKLEAERNRLQSRLQQVVVRDAALRAITAAKGRPKLLGPIVERRLKMVERNGEVETVVVDEHGNEVTGDSYGNPMTLEQLIDEMKNDPEYSAAFEGRNKSGVDVEERGTKTVPGRGEWKVGNAAARLAEARRAQQ